MLHYEWKKAADAIKKDMLLIGLIYYIPKFSAYICFPPVHHIKVIACCMDAVKGEKNEHLLIKGLAVSSCTFAARKPVCTANVQRGFLAGWK